MYTIESFYKEVFKLSKSITFKLSGIDVVMEQNSSDPRLDTKDIADFKYYKHIAGERHKDDEDIFINVIELEEKRLLTKELLETYKLTKEELLKQDEFYNNLVNEYPTLITYIDGCINPLDKQTVFEAEDGTILSFNSKFLEPQEYNLIPELETYIKNYISRWYNKFYLLVDELYLQGFISVLSTSIVNEIVNIRLKNINTNRVHSFFLESFFDSHFSLWNSVSKLNKETILWLYRNLPYMIKNIGQNQTFELLLKKVFEENNVGIGGYNLEYQDTKLNKDVYNHLKLPFNYTPVVASLEKLNKTFIETNNIKSVNEILTEELDLSNYREERKNYLIETYNKNINTDIAGVVPSKVLEINTLETFDSYNRDVYSSIFDTWAYLLDQGLYGSFTDENITSAKVEITDDNTNQVYRVSSKTGFYMVLKILLVIAKKEKERLSNLIYGRAYDRTLNVEKVLANTLHQDGYTEKLYNYIKDNYPLPNVYTSAMEVSPYIESVLDFSKNLWLLDANSENAIVSANIKNFVYLAVKHAKYKIHNHPNGKTIDELLLAEGINFQISKDYNYLSMIREIYLKCLGIKVNDNTEIISLLDTYKDLLNKLTSYTLQAIGSVKSEDNFYLHYNHTAPLFSTNGLIKIDKDKISGVGYEDDWFLSSFTVYNKEDEISNDTFSEQPLLDLCTTQHNPGTLYLIDKEINCNTVPMVRYSLQDLPSRKVNECDLSNLMVRLTSIPTLVKEEKQDTTYLDGHDTVEMNTVNTTPAQFKVDVYTKDTSVNPPLITKDKILDSKVNIGVTDADKISDITSELTQNKTKIEDQ